MRGATLIAALVTPTAALVTPTGLLTRRLAGPVRLRAGVVQAVGDDDAGLSFQEWMARSTPAGAVAREHTLVNSNASTLEGALGQLWSEIACRAQGARGPSLTVVLFARVPQLMTVEGMSAFNSHIMACRDCCTSFGRQLRPLSLHPRYEDERLRSPHPAFTLSSRVGPVELRPAPLSRADTIETEGGEGEEGSLTAAVGDALLVSDGPSTDDKGAPVESAEVVVARQALESLMASPSASKAPDISEEDVLADTMAWFEVYFSRVFRVIGARQRRRVVPAKEGAEQVRTRRQ